MIPSDAFSLVIRQLPPLPALEVVVRKTDSVASLYSMAATILQAQTDRIALCYNGAVLPPASPLSLGEWGLALPNRSIVITRIGATLERTISFLPSAPAPTATPVPADISLGDMPSSSGLHRGESSEVATLVPEHRTPLPTRPLRCAVPSAVGFLDRLHNAVRWTPNSRQIRPTPEIRAHKDLLLCNLQRMWASPADWVYQNVFGSASRRRTDGRREASPPERGTCVLQEQPFPYDVPAGTRHMVFWCACRPGEMSHQAVTAALSQEVDALGGGEFIFYENPKKSVEAEELCHFQVFWLAGYG